MAMENANELQQFPTICKEELLQIDEESEEKKLKRIATLDFFRGFAIFFMIVYHVLMSVPILPKMRFAVYAPTA